MVKILGFPIIFSFFLLSLAVYPANDGRKLYEEGKKLLKRGIKESQFETVSNAIEFLRKAGEAGVECRLELGKALFWEDRLWNRQSVRLTVENETFLLALKNRSPVGVLLLHELGATPFEMRELAEFLHDEGITVYVPRLAGHGTTVADLKRAGPPQWRKNYLLGYEILRLLCDRVYVIGSGWGGVLALELAAKEKLSGVATLNASLSVRGLGKHFLFLTQFSGLSVKWPVPAGKTAAYHERLPLRTYNQAYNVSAYVATRLKEVTEPLVIFQSKNDPLVRAKSAEIIYDTVKSKDKKIFWLENASHHLLDKRNPSNRLTINEIYRFVSSPGTTQ